MIVDDKLIKQLMSAGSSKPVGIEDIDMTRYTGNRVEVYDGKSPTPIQVTDTRDLKAEKLRRLKELKEEASLVIFNKAPLFKQINAALGIESRETINQMKTDIETEIARITPIEQAILDAPDVDTLEQIDIKAGL